MTFPDHNDLDRLKELAELEMFAALDEPETAQLDRDFAEVPACVQDELRLLQSQLATHPAYLGTEEPAGSLRARSVARMMTAAEERDMGYAPIAQIGAPARRVAGRTPVRSIDATELMEQAMATATARSEAQRFARTAYWWRAASIALIAALVVTIYFERQSTWWGQRVGEGYMQRLAREDMLSMLGQPGFRELADGQADIVRGLRLTATDGSGSATVLIDSRNKRALLLTMGLRANEAYTLRVTREDGRKEAVGTIVPQEAVAAVSLPADVVAALATGQLELVDSRGRVVLST